MAEETAMDRDHFASIRALLQATRVLSLAYVSDAGPEAALLPFSPRDDYGALYVQVSTLARHARALQSGSHVGVLVHAQDSATTDAMQLARLSVSAVVSVVDKDNAAYDAASAQFVSRFPAARLTLGFADFSLCMLMLGGGRFVEGFARAFDVSAQTFAEIGKSS